MKLLESFANPYVIHHPSGHTIPRLGKVTQLRHKTLINSVLSFALTLIPIMIQMTRVL
ncbi:hypothetical protein MKW92_036709 [Papaver armeniacum]|nr:hypothetical protein MKW92_036709 [Papaver armeniacum]